MGIVKVKTIIFFDGMCAFCNRTVNFILKRDHGLFHFAPLQGSTALKNLSPDLLGSNPRTIVLLDEKGTHIKSQAIVKIFLRLGWPWKVIALLRLIPNKVTDFFYDYFSEHRYQWFGRYSVCRIPTLQERSRFLE